MDALRWPWWQEFRVALAVGFHDTDLAGLKRLCVEYFPQSRSRAGLFETVATLTKSLNQASIPSRASEFFPPIKRGPDPDFAALHFATHLYATAEFVEAETARGSNQPNCRLSTSSAGRFAGAQAVGDSSQLVFHVSSDRQRLGRASGTRWPSAAQRCVAKWSEAKSGSGPSPLGASL